MALKERLTTAPILAYPDFSIQFLLHNGASGNSIGVNLTQVQNDWERPILYGVEPFMTPREITLPKNEKHCL